MFGDLNKIFAAYNHWQACTTLEIGGGGTDSGLAYSVVDGATSVDSTSGVPCSGMCVADSGFPLS